MLCISLRWPSRQYDWINIVVHKLKNNTKVYNQKYIVTRHKLKAGAYFPLTRIFHRSKYMEGFDRILSVVINMTLNTTRYQNAPCLIRTEKRVLRDLFPKTLAAIRKLIFKDNMM